jgi:TIR domain
VLFISYSREDYRWAQRLATALETAGHKCWIDRQRINAGDVWRLDIENALKQATAVAVIVTQAAGKPESFVRRELHYASVLGKPIYPIVPEPVAAEAMPMQVAELQQIQCAGDFDCGINELLQRLAPLEHGRCVIDVSRKLANILTPESVEYAMMSRFRLLRTIAVKDEITKGNSGSKVFLVDASFCDSTKAPAPHFLKINNAESELPRKRHEMAYQTGLGRHMPKLCDVTPFDEQNKRLGLLYGLDDARGGFASLQELLRRNLGQAAMLIRQMCDALTEWNDRGCHSKQTDFLELLRHALCNSLDPESRNQRLDSRADSSVFRRSASLLNLTAETQLVDFGTRYGLPNPVAYMADNSLWKHENQDLSVTYPSGHVHGDLHTRNIQAIYKTRDRKRLDLSVIDFDTYDPENLIFLDFAALEISIIIRLFGIDQSDCSQERHYELERLSAYLAATLDLPADIPDLNVMSVGTCIVLRPLREAAAGIADLHFDYQRAFWVARAAAGLALVRKRRSTHQERVLAVLIAGDSIKHLVEELDLTSPRGNAQKLEWASPNRRIQHANGAP